MPLARRTLASAVRRPARWVHGRTEGWATASQQGSRRNAMVASTRLAQRRVEAEEVSLYLAGPPRAAGRSVADAPERVAQR